MNCEQCQELVSGLVDGVLSQEDQLSLNAHLKECLSCADVRNDLEAIVGFCRTNRGEYGAPPNPKALWLRIRNTIEAENSAGPEQAQAVAEQRDGFWRRLSSHSWQLSFPQLAASAAAIVLVVALTTVVGVRRFESGSTPKSIAKGTTDGFDLNGRKWQQQQAIKYWNARVETNRVRWSPQMRDTFDRNLSVIEQAVNDSLKELNTNPHDEVSEEMLNAALNEKIALLKEFSEL
ncbi:MAG TPA: zf-HC2 domain-containing protein [Pyrinomonadaceae bacterium]|nr:zf-HC2 domain-containing protein [Pyrinomonadaceae bacterium]